MPDRLVVASVQANPTVGDIAGNEALARARMAQATAAGADIALFSELFLIGYPPEDLALKPAAVRACGEALARLARDTAGGCATLMTLPWPGKDRRPRNAVALIAEGEIRGVSFKIDLPNYGVFDEKADLRAGRGAGPVRGGGREDRGSGVRGYLGPGALPGPEGAGGGDPAGTQRLAVPPHRRR